MVFVNFIKPRLVKSRGRHKASACCFTGCLRPKGWFHPWGKHSQQPAARCRAFRSDFGDALGDGSALSSSERGAASPTRKLRVLHLSLAKIAPHHPTPQEGSENPSWALLESCWGLARFKWADISVAFWTFHHPQSAAK